MLIQLARLAQNRPRAAAEPALRTQPAVRDPRLDRRD
jgi:hypothetical protein